MFDDRDRPVGLRRHQLEESFPTAQEQTFHHAQGYFGNLAQLSHPYETPLFWACAIFSLLFYPLLLCMYMFLPFILSLLALGFISNALMVGHIRGNSVRVSPQQFSRVYHAAEAMSHQLGLKQVPSIYVVESGGMINAFAARFLLRNYVILYSDVVEMAYEQGEDTLNFVVAHELAHIARGHVRRQWLVKPAFMLPFLLPAYYRACEYSCDLIAAHCSPTGAIAGIATLAAGKKLSKHLNVGNFAAQSKEEAGFLVWFAELMSSHPRLPQRLQAVMSTHAVQATSQRTSEPVIEQQSATLIAS